MDHQESILNKESHLNLQNEPHVAEEINNNPTISTLNDVSQNQVDTPTIFNSPKTLTQPLDTNDNFFLQVGGIQHIAAALESDIENGIVGDQDDLQRRRNTYGSNQSFDGEFNSLVNEGLRKMVLKAFKNTTVILLLCCAALSLAIGIKINGPKEGIFYGALIFLSIFLVVNFGIICRYIKCRWMIKKLLKHKKVVCVVRQGKNQTIYASEVVVGDVVSLRKGDEVPADGFFIRGDQSFKLDCVAPEASLYTECTSMFTGSMVSDGSCQMLVTSVGTRTERSKLMRLTKKQQSDQHHNQHGSKLENAIEKLSSNVENVWLSLSLLVLVVQVFRCFALESKCDKDHNPDPKGVKNTMEEIMNQTTKVMRKQSGKVNGLVATLCILIFSLRDFLPLGIYIIFLYASKKAKPFKAIVRKLPACATLGLITTICLSKTDELALQYTKMAELWMGLRRIQDISGEVNQQVVKVFREAIYCTNSSGYQAGDDALLCWGEKVLGMDVDELQKSCEILHGEAPDLPGSSITMVLKQGNEPGTKMLENWRSGDPVEILSMCSQYCDVDGSIRALDEEKRARFNEMVANISSDSVKCFAFAYKQVLQEDDHADSDSDSDSDSDNEGTLESLEHDLTWLGLVTLKNPYPPEVRKSMEACLQSGVNIKLVVADDVKTATIMAQYSGILKPGNYDTNQAVIDASIFRDSPEEDRKEMIDSIRVLANASSIDKLLIAQCLRQKAEVVAVVGSCSRDYPSLMEADIGVLMRSHCGECTKEDVDIVVLGLNLEMISTLVKFGRCVCKNLEKFIELQLTINIASFTINFIVVISTSEVQFTPFQLLWVNLIMEILGALALSIQMVVDQVEQSTTPVYGAGRIITKTMSRNIAVQSLYQVTISLILKLKGKEIFHVNEGVMKTMIFIFYVMCQVFALVGAMKIKKTSLLEGLIAFKNYMFIMIVIIIVIMQVVLIEIMAIIDHWRKLNLKLWCICAGIASLTMFLDYAVNYLE